MLKNIIIIGAGISAATLANILAHANWRIKIYEKQNHIGGHCFDFLSKDEILYHRFGPHIFHTDNDQVIKFIQNFAKFNNYINKVQVELPNNEFTQLPFNFTQIQKKDPQNGLKIINYLKQKFPNQPKVSILELQKHQDFAPLNAIVDWLYNNVYAPYTAKMWGVEISKIDPSVIARVGITLSDNESYFPTAKLQGLPIGGYTKMIQKMLDHKNIEVHLNVDGLSHLQLRNNQMFWNNIKLGIPVVYCGPIEALLNYKYGILPYRSLEFKFETFNVAKKQKFPIINYPKHKTKTRTVEYNQMTQQKTKKTIISTEYPGAFNIQGKKWNIPYYPINNESNNSLYKKYLNNLASYKNLHLLGRLAEYKYLDMDASILSAINLAQKFLKML